MAIILILLSAIHTYLSVRRKNLPVGVLGIEATFSFSGVSGGLTTYFCSYGRGGRIRTGDHLNPM